MLELSRQLSDLVAKTMREFENLSQDKAAEKVTSDEGWSRKQVLGHLIDSAANNHQRFVRAMLQDEVRLPSYDPEGCVRVQLYQDMTWSELLTLWTAYNQFLAHVLAAVPPDKLSTPCYVGDNPVMTFQELAADYLVHMQHHLDQLK